ncbi:MAG: hypothetical protein ACFE85_11705 [Candidatus Hodarchaeota archaeon]
MAKSGAILGIIGIILGAGGLGLGGYMWISLSRVENQVNNISGQSTWYKYNESNFESDPAFTYLPFFGLTIEFELGFNESVYFNFMAMTHLEPAVGWSQMYAYFRVDGVIDTTHYAMVGLYNGQTASLMITLQHKRYDLSLGEHNVTVVIYGTSTGNYIYHSSLFVQEFSV